jgi:hypothetical protein
VTVQRSQILDYVTYSEQRDEIRAATMTAKALRRLHVGPHLTFLFENDQTVRYQVLEMVRVERMVKESVIQHELDTYNELLGGPGELGATLLIEIADESLRAELLPKWLGLMPTLYLERPDGTRIAPTWDERQVGRGRLSAVQYLRFPVQGAPVAIGCSHPDPLLNGRYELTTEQRSALTADLR